MRKLTRLALLSGLMLLLPAQASTAKEIVRGTIDRWDGQTLVVKSREGAELKVVLADKAFVYGVVKASTSDIKQGLAIGVTAIAQADGSPKALEVHILPPTVLGKTHEGHSTWDLKPQSTMTNGSVTAIVAGVAGPTLTVKYKDGEQKIVVPPDTPVVTYVRSDRGALVPGAKVFFIGGSRPDGTLLAARIDVGINGVEPPM